MNKLIECVPNFSEGRDQTVIDAIAGAVQQAGAHVLDVSSDADHNRTVVTFAGEPDVVVEAAFAAIREAASRIDLTAHSGVHPRVGAADVVPFIPLRGTDLAFCAGLAHQLGKRVGEKLGLPVFLYEAAATHPSRQNLADIRRGGYERLSERMEQDPLMQPDYGPTMLGPAGAVVTGARAPLIAFNAYLDTGDVGVARQVAKTVRTSSGGLPFLKALGLLVDGRAQVSMNVIDFRETSLHTILEAVRVAAAEHGATVTETELVGLVPQAALLDAALAYMGLPASVRELTLEKRLGGVTGDYQEIPFA